MIDLAFLRVPQSFSLDSLAKADGLLLIFEMYSYCSVVFQKVFIQTVTTVLKHKEYDLCRMFIWCSWSTFKFLYCTYYQGYMPLDIWDIPKCSSDLSAQLSFVVEVWCDSNLVFLETYFLHLKMSVTVWSISLDYITVACNTQEIWKICCIKLPLRKLWYSK